MVGFDWDEFYAILSKRIKDKYPNCTVGRCIIPKQSQFPYVDISLGAISGNEETQTPLIVVNVYDIGSVADRTCNKISEIVKEIMLSYGFQRRGGPLPVDNPMDMTICRWVGRYERVFGNDDVLK